MVPQPFLMFPRIKSSAAIYSVLLIKMVAKTIDLLW